MVVRRGGVSAATALGQAGIGSSTLGTIHVTVAIHDQEPVVRLPVDFSSVRCRDADGKWFGIPVALLGRMVVPLLRRDLIHLTTGMASARPPLHPTRRRRVWATSHSKSASRVALTRQTLINCKDCCSKSICVWVPDPSHAVACTCSHWVYPRAPTPRSSSPAKPANAKMPILLGREPSERPSLPRGIHSMNPLSAHCRPPLLHRRLSPWQHTRECCLPHSR